jgi:hypothetical protein
MSIRNSPCRYDISILQAEFSLTQVLDRPLAGRVFFEDVGPAGPWLLQPRSA